ncbi:MAG TPA: polysaccharide pyruvyl transferase family protein, partial [Gemmatimonadaceae bacterium]|nr:polysaccharide pyruvyl transferase family protein [Gemmatimonadaceae bacterium]
EPNPLGRARDVFNAHARLTLLLRDQASVDEARRHFSATIRLAPDIAFGLHPVAAQRPQRQCEVLWLKRDDQEDRWAKDGALPAGSVRADWAEEARTPLVRLHDAAVPWARRSSARAHPARALLRWLYPRLARERLASGIALLGGARVVVTDRLHGHILSVLLGLPHVVLDNSYGKLGRFLDAWTGSSPLVRRATSPEEAAELARALARTAAVSGG